MFEDLLEALFPGAASLLPGWRIKTSGIRRKQTRETREHTPRCIAGDAGIENLGRASFGPKQTLQLGWESLVH